MLLNLTRSLLLNFLELLHILSSNPSSEEYGPKWEDMRDLFRNAHEILNLYRPWQSRAALIGIMEDMISKGREEIESVKTLKQNVDSVLKGLQESLAAEEKNAWLSGEEPNGTENKRTGEESRMWSSIIDEVDQE